MLLRRRIVILLSLPIFFVLIGLVLYPSLRTFSLGASLELYQKFFEHMQTANMRALINSVWLSIATVLGAGGMGTALAWILFRYNFPFRKVLLSVAALPLALPPLVGVLAFLFLYGETGILPRVIQEAFSMSEVPFSFEGLMAVWLVQVYALNVYFYLFVTAALQQLDGSLLEASADMGASAGRTFVKVILPALRPSMTNAGILVFMLSMASFTAPLMFAGTENFLTLQIYNYKTNGNLEMSAAVSIVLTLICLAFLLISEFRRRTQNSTSKGTTIPPRPATSGLARIVAGFSAFSMLIFLLLPVATIFLISFAAEGSWTYQLFPESYTFDNYLLLFQDPDVFAPILNSLTMAGIATAGNLVFGIVAALIIIKSNLPGRYLLRVLTMLPFAIPGTVIALNMIIAFNDPTIWTFGQILVGSFWILPLAYFVRHIPLVVRATSAALENYDDRLTEASSDLGAGAWRTFRKVMLPLIAPGILAGTLLAFVTALGEFVSSIMLYVYSNRPISVEILSKMRLYDFGAAAAYSVFLMILIGFSTLIIAKMAKSNQNLSVL